MRPQTAMVAVSNHVPVWYRANHPTCVKCNTTSEVHFHPECSICTTEFHPEDVKNLRQCGFCDEIHHYYCNELCAFSPQYQRDSSTSCEMVSNSDARAFVLLAMIASAQDVWVVDSGAEMHYTNRDDHLQGFRKQLRGVRSASNAIMTSPGSGSVGRLMQVRLVKGLIANLLSVPRLCMNGYTVLFDGKNCEIKNSELGVSWIAQMTRNGLYMLNYTCVLHDSTTEEEGVYLVSITPISSDVL